ncbi:MAG TPA: ABC transporter permease [Chloroflexota bacterium]|nr:ABC transporter permease [Chloroflexota bacterium]
MAVITPVKRWRLPDFAEFWQYRELLYFLVWRDVKVRYKQTAIGAGWAVLRPLATMTVFVIFFNHLAGMPSDGIPYPAFAYAALLPWTFVASSVTEAALSVTTNANLVSRVYFPRVFLPVASALACLLDLAVAFVVLAGILIFYRITPGPRVLTLPLFLLLALGTAIAIGVWLAAINVRYRDVKATIPFLVQLWLFLSPVLYSVNVVPQQWRALYGLNPMVGVIEGFRWALLGQPQLALAPVVVSTMTVAGLLTVGLMYFWTTECEFADVI